MTARRALSAILGAGFAVAVLAAVRPRPADLPPPRTRAAEPAGEVRRVSARRPSRPGPVRTADGPVITTPFSVIAVRVTLTGDELTKVETVALSGADARTKAINDRAEPILREEALRAGSAKIDVVSGATYTSESYKESLQAAIDRARRA